MTGRVNPAMQPEEWAAQFKRSPEKRRECLLWAKDEADADGYLTIHGLAALCLYGQPFGFTREEIRELATVADELDNDVLHAIALKLDALLPPE